MSFGVFRPSLRSRSWRCSMHARLLEPHFAFGDLPLRRFELRAIQPERGLQRGVVEPREHLALADRHAFLDVHLDHLAGDLRRHRGAAPRRDVARRVQHRRLRAGRALGDGRDFDFDRPLAVQPIPGAATGAAEQARAGHDPFHPAPAARVQRFALDAQRGQVVEVSATDQLPLDEASNDMRRKSEKQFVRYRSHMTTSFEPARFSTSASSGRADRSSGGISAWERCGSASSGGRLSASPRQRPDLLGRPAQEELDLRVQAAQIVVRPALDGVQHGGIDAKEERFTFGH